MLPPQLQVGDGLHTLDVMIHEFGPDVVVELIPAGGRKKIGQIPMPQRAERRFTLSEWPNIEGWLYVEGTRIGEHLDKLAKQELRRKGYRV